MATGRLGASDLAATTNTTVYTVPSNKIGTFNLNVCNRNATAVKVRIALAATGTPSVGEYIEYDTSIPAWGVLERTGLVLAATQNAVVYSDTANVSAVAYGYEE